MMVYIIKCSDGTYYTGVTNDLERRLTEHNEGHNPLSYTYTRRPVKLMFAAGFNDPQEAINFEKQVKGWSRKKKEALFIEEWQRIKELAQCNNESSHIIFRKDNNISS